MISFKIKNLKLQNFFREKEKIILALSGGPDSVFLGEKIVETYCLSTMSSRPNGDASLRKNIIVAHFNHKLRDDSKKDENFCKEWAEKKGCVFETEEWENPIDSEEKARNARYAFLEKIRKKYDAAGIFVGTHASDNVETIFFQFLRGSGAKGLSGIAAVNEKRKIFRPLLQLRKKEIVDFLEEKNIPYCLDSTNKESEYSRNFLRNKIIPLLDEKFPFWQKNILRQAEIFEEMDEYLEEQASKFLKMKNEELRIKNGEHRRNYQSPEENVGNKYLRSIEKENKKNKEEDAGSGFQPESPVSGKEKNEERYSRKEFSTLHKALQNYILRKIFSPKALDFEQIKNIREFIKNGKSGKKMQLKGKEILLSQDFFFVEEL